MQSSGLHAFEDRVQGRYSQQVAAAIGDYVVWRRDDIASYQLAVVVDDALMGVTHIVRGADLLDNTPRQLHLGACLGKAKPSYAHVPIVAEASGVKLSKHNAATAIDDRAARYNIRNCWPCWALIRRPATSPRCSLGLCNAGASTVCRECRFCPASSPCRNITP